MRREERRLKKEIRKALKAARWIIRHPSLKPSAVLVYAYLADRANRDLGNLAWPGQRLIAEELHMSTKTVNLSITELEDAGALTVKRDHRKVNQYTVNVVEPTTPPNFLVVETTTKTVRESTTQQEPLEQEPDNNILDTFESIWGEYPNKVGKHQAIANYKKALRHHSPQDLLQAVRNYSEEVAGRDKVYIKTGGNFFSKGFYPDYLPGQYGQTETPAMREYEGEL